MGTVRISEIANELGYPSKEIVEKANELGLKVKTHSSGVTPEEAEALYTYVQTGEIPESFKKKPEKKKSEPKKSAPKQTKEQKENKDAKKESSKTTKKDDKVAEKTLKTRQASTKQPKEKVEIPEIKSEIETKENTRQKEDKQPEKPVIVEKKLELKESLADVSLQKRRGLMIVKKKKEESATTPRPIKQAEKTENEPIRNLESMFSFNNAESTLKKKKKEKKPVIATKKDGIQKVDLLSDRDLADIVLEDEDVVVLPDFSVRTPAPQPTQKTKQTNIYKPSLNNSIGSFLEQGISRRSRKKHKKVSKDSNNSETITSIEIPKEIRVYEFAEKLNKQPSEIISKLFMLGMMTTKNDFLDEDSIEILADEFGVEINIVDIQEAFDYVKAYDEQNGEENLTQRAPVITIMGHVDHGKTSLLDYIRNSRVASGEAGGITQHVGAYMVNKNNRNITFIDTPGHEAFTAMRARGAGVTDIVIIVVAADDGVKPQTKEAISHAKAANVPIIIAINKMDKEAANPDKVKSELADLDILSTEWGGAYEFVPISAKTGMGIEDLLEIVLLQADILELKANAKANAKATIIESSQQKGRGPVATIIVENGTLKVGDTVVAGVSYGKIRSITDDKANVLKEIKPGECGVIMGLSEIPEAGETLISVKTDKEAREYAQKKAEYLRQKELSKTTKVSLEELSEKIAEGELKSLPVIVKADVGGSLEAIKSSLEKLRNDEIKVNIIHSGVGGITQSDVALAKASENSVILGFNIRPTGEIKEKAKESGIEIKTYNVIYNLLDDVKVLLSGLMSPILREEHLGQAQVRQVINVPKIGAIAGCMVTEGSINRGAKIRLIRNGIVVHEGTVSSLKRFKDDVREVAKGYECGVGIDGYNDIREGDYIESFKEIEEQATL